MIAHIGIIFFAHLYGMGTNVPVHTQEVRAERLLADHGFVMTTPEWNRLSIEHRMTTQWAQDRNPTKGVFVGSTWYEVNLRARVSDALTVTAGHMSAHNADTRIHQAVWNRIGVEVKL